MFKKSRFVLICVIFSLICVICVYAQEQLTITTYYPSPYGVYNEMRLYPHSPATTTCDSTQEGLMYYDSNTHNLYICRDNGATYAWESGGGGYWAASGNDIYNTNTGNVGIGTTGPGAKLEVAGQVKITGGTPGASKVLTSDANGLATWAGIVAFNYSGATVFNGDGSPTFTDLDLSSYVGANRALVYLSVLNNSPASSSYFFRTNGITQGIGYDAAASPLGAGCTGATIEGGRRGYLLVMTDASGIVEWIGGASVMIILEAYIKLE